MKPILLNAALPDMAEIGSVTNLGSTVIEGDPQASIAMLDGSPEDAVACGIFKCTKGVFSMQYPFTEHATILQGSLKLKNLETGEEETFGPGDSWFVAQGSKIEWHVLSDYFVKHYLSVAK
jgi:uncharacterized cupin superfamily protein